jgi:cytochrome c
MLAIGLGLVTVAAAPGPASPDPATLGFGRPATPQEIAAEDIDVRADGAGLPPGHGSVKEGEALYASTCAACHGEHGEKPLAASLRLTGGKGTLATPSAIKTVGSYWPYSTTLFDYIRRAMPLPAPRSLTDDQVYALCAYVLHLNGIVPDDTVLDARTLPQIRMPNRDGFTSAYTPAR